MEKRKSFKQLGLKFILTTSLILTLGACGQQKEALSTAESSASETITTQNVQASLKDVTLKVGTSGVFAPFSYYDTDGSTLVGYDIDLIKELQGILGFKIANDQISAMDYSALTTSIVEKKLDIVAAALCVTDERQKVMDFSNVYLDSGLRVMINKTANSGITDVNSLAGKKVTVEKGTASHAYAEKYLTESELDVYDKITGSYQALEQNKVDALIQDSPNCAFYIKENPTTNLEMVGEEFNQGQSPYALGLQKNSKYRDNFNAALAILEENGTLQKLKTKWTE